MSKKTKVPALAPESKKADNIEVTVYLAPDEKAWLEKQSKAAGISISEHAANLLRQERDGQKKRGAR